MRTKDALNIRALLSCARPALLNIPGALVTLGSMKPASRLLLICCWLALSAGPLQAACYADYKAKQDDPLRLHYGVIALSDDACARPATAKREAEARIAAGGWSLLNILSTFSDEGLAERKKNAGPYYLRF